MQAIKIVVEVVLVVAVCFYLHSKEKLIIIENKIERRLQIGRPQLNYIRYNMYKNIAHGHCNSCAKKVIIVFNVHIPINVQKRHCSFGKSSIFGAIILNLYSVFGAKYDISKIIELSLSVVNIF